jgi:hypothetical protein
MSHYNYASSATASSLSAAASQASTVTGAAFDLLDYEGAVAIVQNHGLGTGTLDGKIQDSADGSTGWADVTGAVFTQSTTTADSKVIALQAKQCKRYIRYVGTIVTGPHLLGVSLIGLKKSV